MLITFSGLDGAGKSTLISSLKTNLEKQDRNVTVLTMYDHVGLYALVRSIRDSIKKLIGKDTGWLDEVERFSNDPELGLLPPGRSWLARVMFSALRSKIVKRSVYIFDLCMFQFIRVYFEKVKNHILIMDRYFYDSLADVTDRRQWLYTRLCLFFTPVPDLPILVDGSPEEAFARKGEYSVEYLTNRRIKYLRIFRWVYRSLILVNKDLDAAVCVLNGVVSERLICR